MHVNAVNLRGMTMAKAGNKLDIIFEDEYMIACVKPYGVSVQPDNGDGEDLMTAVKNYLYDGASEEEHSFLGVVDCIRNRAIGSFSGHLHNDISPTDAQARRKHTEKEAIGRSQATIQHSFQYCHAGTHPI